MRKKKIGDDSVNNYKKLTWNDMVMINCFRNSSNPMSYNQIASTMNISIENLVSELIRNKESGVENAVKVFIKLQNVKYSNDKNRRAC